MTRPDLKFGNLALHEIKDRNRPVERTQFEPGSKEKSVFVPLSRMISPVTKTNWEGVGVTPDVSVCADDALGTAQVAILKKMAESEKNAVKVSRLKDRIAEIVAANTAGARCR